MNAEFIPAGQLEDREAGLWYTQGKAVDGRECYQEAPRDERLPVIGTARESGGQLTVRQTVYPKAGG